jgi:hypothetical protein
MTVENTQMCVRTCSRSLSHSCLLPGPSHGTNHAQASLAGSQREGRVRSTVQQELSNELMLNCGIARVTGSTFSLEKLFNVCSANMRRLHVELAVTEYIFHASLHSNIEQSSAKDARRGSDWRTVPCVRKCLRRSNLLEFGNAREESGRPGLHDRLVSGFVARSLGPERTF